MTDPHLVAVVQRVQRDRRRCEMSIDAAEAWRAGAAAMRAAMLQVFDDAVIGARLWEDARRDMETAKVPEPRSEPTGLEYRGG